jgi:hypothetical protein
MQHQHTETVKHQAYNTTQHYQPDGSIARDEINTWFALRIKKQLMKEAMEWQVFVINVN